MKFRALLLSSILAAGVSLSASAFAADDQQKTQTPASSTQPATGQTQTPSQPAATPATDQSQVQPATGQDQTKQPAADQPIQPAPDADQDQAQPADKTDKDKKDAKNSGSKSKHKGGKDDVDAIGNRKVTGMDWYSIETEIRMGKEYATQIETSLKLVNDPVINEYVNRVGQNLVRNSDARPPVSCSHRCPRSSIVS